MPKITAKVTFNKPAAMMRIQAANNAALTDMGNQALQDVTQYVPRDQGTLEESGDSTSDQKAVDGVFTLRWSTPYAQYLWNGDVMFGNPVNRTYGPKKITFTKALACEEWAKYAQEVHGAEWEKIYQAALERRLRQ